MPALKGCWQAKPGAGEGKTLTKKSNKSLGANRRGKFPSHPDHGCRRSDKARQGLSVQERQWTKDTKKAQKACFPIGNKK
ncbi:hypothetical protein PanWU01x14_237480 [Parasponia andersonii]|uniref:Uncharacterized protein n=1 Tax=Parasponia andersonii TaxID=3476 RepID=A0A2P5BHX8_PARAD|nr:hypothetical protein PanWU01x14_237480 [Parasponia andersonii]